MSARLRLAGPLAAVLLLAACGKGTAVFEDGRYGPDPAIPKPDYAAFPPIRIAEVAGWPGGRTPEVAGGLAVSAFATGLIHPRWILPLPNGDLLVAESDKAGEPVKRPKDLVMMLLMGQAKGGATPPNRISLLRDRDGDGRADSRTTYIDGLEAPFGMALVGSDLYVADTGALLRYRYVAGADRPAGAAVKLTDLPGGPINHHWTKNVVASPDGARLYVTVGSNSNVGENGMEHEVGRAAVWEVDPATGAHRIYASGLRNPNGMDWNPATGALWTVVNERDEIGDDASPDYLTSLRPGGFYGWPWSYWGHVDGRPYPARPDMVARAIKPDYAIGSHTGSLGLTFADGASLGPAFASGAFVGQHGSWNRSQPIGYRVIFVPFAGGQPNGSPVVVLGGFLDGDRAFGRPVGVAIDRNGALLVADDAGNTVWRVTASPLARAIAEP